MAVGFSPDRGAQENYGDENDVRGVGHSKEVRELLKDLDNGISDKVNLLKMILLKCGDASSNYKKVRGLMNKGDINSAEK
jgi:hypothetical protein